MATSTRNATSFPNEGVLETGELLRSHSCFINIMPLSKAHNLRVTTEGLSMQSVYFQLFWLTTRYRIAMEKGHTNE